MAGSSDKVFVGGLPQSCADETLRSYFMQFGNIIDSVVMKDRETGNSRGFGFVTYDNTGPVDMVIAQHDDHKIEGKFIDVKRATPRDQMPAGGTDNRGRGGRGGGPSGGDRGGDRDRRSGDWTCLSCNSNVFASKETCFKCGAAKPQGGGSAPPPVGYPCAGTMPGMPPMDGSAGSMPQMAVYGGSYPGMPPAGYGYPGYYGAAPGYPMYPGYPAYGAAPMYPGYPAYPMPQQGQPQQGQPMAQMQPMTGSMAPPMGYAPAPKGDTTALAGNGYRPY